MVESRDFDRLVRAIVRVSARAGLVVLAGGVLMSAGTGGPPTPPDSPLKMEDVMSSTLYRDLSDRYMLQPPPETWNGSRELTEK